MTEQEWVEFLATGIPQSVSVARIPAELSRALNCPTQLVQMHHSYATKAYHKHGIDPHRLPMVSITIDLGRVILDKRGHLQFFYFEEVIFRKMVSRRGQAKQSLHRALGIVASHHKIRRGRAAFEGR